MEREVLEMRGPKGRKGRPRCVRRSVALTLGEEDGCESGICLGSPGRMARQNVHELLGLFGGALCEGEQLLVARRGAERRGLARERRERLAACGGPPLLRREADCPLEVLPHPLRVAGRRADEPAHGLQLSCPKRRRLGRCHLRGAPEPRFGLVDLPQLEVSRGEACSCRELERPVSQHTSQPVGVLAAREREIGHDLGAREDLHAVEHLRLDRRALALARQRCHLRCQPPDLLDPVRRSEHVEIESEVDVRTRDHRRHDAATVADLLEQLDRPLVAPDAVGEVVRDGSAREDLLRRGTGRDARHELDDLSRLDAVHVPLPHARDRRDSELSNRRRVRSDVAQLLRQLARPPIRLRRPVEVDVARRAERLAERASQQVLPQLEARSELGSPVTALVRRVAHPARELRRLLLVLRDAKRGSPSQLDVEPQMRVAKCLC